MSKRKKTSREELAAAAHLQMLAGLLDWVRLTRSSNYVSTPEGKRELEAFANEMIKNWRPLAALPSDRPGMVQYVDAERAAELACGFAFEAGMREAERDDERSRPNREAARRYEQESRHLSEMRAAVAAERERCAAWARRNFHAGDTVLDIESGAPAPRE